MLTSNGPLTQLRQRLAAFAAEVPALTGILRGTVAERFVCCGKDGCRCQGGHKHGPIYFLGVSQGRGHTHQVTLSKEAYELAQRYVANQARLGALIEEAARLNWELLRLTHPTSRKRPPGKEP